jgi:Glycine zipper
MKKKIYLLVLSLFSVLLLSTNCFAQRHYQKKKHWSHRKKDAVIGGAGGAATGALVSRHHARGAVIGGAVGAGGGYLIGKHKDKKVSR